MRSNSDGGKYDVDKIEGSHERVGICNDANRKSSGHNSKSVDVNDNVKRREFEYVEGGCCQNLPKKHSITAITTIESCLFCLSVVAIRVNKYQGSLSYDPMHHHHDHHSHHSCSGFSVSRPRPPPREGL